ncbi:FeoB-associated Cys-rich membrane protein [uncultured Traorella sp.]|nr:FeoB-associated Cys-rich membrane protein [uncultured Traorella sp.]
MDIVVLLILAGCVVLALRSIRKSKSCGCSGNCAGCQKCSRH